MPLYINDPAVEQLVDQVMAATGIRTKTEALRFALRCSLASLEDQETIAEHVAKIQDRAAISGLQQPNMSDNDFMDEMWDVD